MTYKFVRRHSGRPWPTERGSLCDCAGMLAQLKRSFPDLYNHKTHQPLHNTYCCVRPLSLFYSDASADGVEERSLVPRSRSHARLKRNVAMSHAFSLKKKIIPIRKIQDRICIKCDPYFIAAAQSTPQTYRGRASVRRQSSAGPLNDTSPLTGGAAGGAGGGAVGEPVVSTPAHSATLPVSSLSTNPSSYYTNASPSPPAAQHFSCDDILEPSAPPVRAAPSSRSAPHSATNLHQTGRPTALTYSTERANHAQDTTSPQYQNVMNTASVATVLVRLEELSRRVAVLESGLTSDVRRILQLLQARDVPAPAAPSAHTPSQPIPKASLTVPRQNDVSEVCMRPIKNLVNRF
ncbi:hypothetical protein EVAR_31662_1 [Eumeta japonica]|uniref:Uncharacterized protein n=1 Tax=Eumeta variegata TaxID=151549 RepID=A0A4C1VUP0_EUMVA|nr:hypothetical protein EVAR_31662_1 [Eumeta japonica]